MDALLLASYLTYPNIDPIIFEIGPFALRWYSIGYIAGIMFAWWYVVKLLDSKHAAMSRQHADDFVVWATLGIILGGRLGYVLFYNPGRFMADPLEIFMLQHGGMSFHGGLLGVIVAEVIFARKYKLSLRRFTDTIACGVPVGLMLVRLANFINGELWGRVTDVRWAMIFPGDPSGLPRHPSQLYEAFFEGPVIFALLAFFWFRTPVKRWPGFISGLFMAAYACARFGIEFVREPDAHLGPVFLMFTMGQLLTVPMLLFGIGLMMLAYKDRLDKPKPAGK